MSQTSWPIEKRLGVLQLILFAIALLVWMLFTEQTQGKLAEMLFWVGLGSLCLGVAIICGAWRGLRDADIDLIMGPSHKRHARLFRDVRRAYSDLNIFALAGCINIALSFFI